METYEEGSPTPQPPPQAFRFSHRRGERETRMTGDAPQGTMGRVQTAGEARLARCLLPAFLCAHIFIDRETSGNETVHSHCQATPRQNVYACARLSISGLFFSHTFQSDQRLPRPSAVNICKARENFVMVI